MKENSSAVAEWPQEERERLNLLHRLLEGTEGAAENRRRLLRWCERNSESERRIWRELALFSEEGALGVLCDGGETFSWFDGQDEKVRERILALIGRLPFETLADFRELVLFTDRFLERIGFMADQLLYVFLEREKGAWRESQDSGAYTDLFVERVFQETDLVRDMAWRRSLAELNDRYEDWLSQRSLDAEVPL